MAHVPAYSGKDPYIFVSYAHLDDDVVMREIAWLNQKGFNVWYDEGISGGSAWREEIAQAIKNAAQVLFYVSENSLSSSVCIKEVNYALTEDVRVLPIYLTPAELPDGLKLSLSDIQALFVYEEAGQRYREKLIQALSATMESNREAVIAVLPFRNLADDKKLDDFFCHGIAEEVINGLVQSKLTKVVARSRSFNPGLASKDVSEIGQSLNATHVVEGSVRMFGDRVRVSVQLIEVEAANTIWSDSLDRAVTDILQVHDDIIRELLSSLNVNPGDDAAQALQIDASLHGHQDSPPQTPDRGNASFTILVVDDEELNHDMLSRRLKRSGYQVLLASSGYAALGIIEVEKVDLVLLDIMMPGVDGMQVLQNLREKRSESELPIIMVSALTDSDVMVKALSSGANDYVTKPLDFPLVLARIEAQLRNKNSLVPRAQTEPQNINDWNAPGAESKQKIELEDDAEQTWNAQTVAASDQVLMPNRDRSSTLDSTTGTGADETPKILLVEDNEMNRDMLTRRLTRRGYEVITANDGEQALKQARAEQPALILMDLRMPVMDGWEATRSLKSDPALAVIPIIALSAHTMDTDEKKALDAGCDGFETKPVVLPRLLEKITELLI